MVYILLEKATLVFLIKPYIDPAFLLTFNDSFHWKQLSFANEESKQN